jgi:hypothetical protein
MEEILHSIKASLHENFLTDDPNDYSAKVISERSLNVKEICKTAVSRGGAQTSAETMEHNVNLFLKEMAYQLMDGYAINTGWFTANAQIRGVFNGKTETFNHEKHSVLFRFNQGDLLRKEIPNIKVNITGVGDSGILISHVVDSKSGAVNDIITPGGTLKIKGGKLKIAGDNPDIGISFEDQNGNIIKVEQKDIIVNKPSELIIQIPNLTPGKYQLTICNQFANGVLLKEPRTAVYDKVLSVARLKSEPTL